MSRVTHKDPRRRRPQGPPAAALAGPSETILGLMPAGANEPQEVVAGDVGRRSVLQRMAIDAVAVHELGVDDEAHAPLRVVDEGEGSS